MERAGRRDSLTYSLQVNPANVMFWLGRLRTMCYSWSIPISGFLVLACMLPADAPVRSYRLPSTDLKERVIWGSNAEGPGGTGLAFGGEDQRADDGQAHTRILVKEKW